MTNANSYTTKLGFFLFYQINDNNFWLDIIKSPRYQSWRGYAFESVCYKHVSNIKKALNINVSTKIGAWKYFSKTDEISAGSQIDLLLDRSDDTVTLCEIIYSDNLFVIDKNGAESLKRLASVFATVTRSKKQIFLAMITANGLKQNSYAKTLINNVVTLKDIFGE